ncbi:MAG: hypothetical protein KC877_01755 [Candidatus Kaiserbacteria bacterium]|nr:hypothetical protein [Candidatus Kaiserbacteria bacterium]MCB9815925.1 hypothetical protein [Candidatus Nomurabacteria bacterium]
MNIGEAPVRGLHTLQKISMSLMGVLVLLTFIGANLHALLWQSSEWLVSTVLPAVVVDLTNEERAELSAAPLQRNALLDEAARLKAEHMAKNEYFAHYSPSGVSPWHWFNEVGYVYAHAGENLAIHFTDSDEVVEAWMDSPTHRQNIIDPKYTEIGVGTAKGTYEGYNTVYVVQLFGAPAVAPAPRPVPVAPTPTPAPEPLVVASAPEQVVEAVPELASLPVPVPVAVDSESTSRAEVIEEAAIETPVVVAVEETSAPESAPIAEPEPTEEQTISFINDVVVVSSPVIATSSGLAVAEIIVPQEQPAGATIVSYATRPNEVLQWTYFVLGTLVLLMLSTSIALGLRRLHYVQVAYGFALIIAMGGLWYAHSLLTTGAVIV